MKRTISLVSICVMLIVGCSTLNTFQNNAGKFLASTALSVDAAMHGWGVWVATGKTTPQEETNVKAIYQQYQQYMGVATNAYALAVKANDPNLFTVPSNNLFMAKVSLVSATTKGN